MKKVKYISIRQLKEHEFHCTLRYLKSGGKSWSDIYLRLGEVLNEAIVRLMKTSSSLVIVYILLSSLAKDGLITVEFQSYKASLPAAYLVSFGAFISLIFAQHLLTVISLISLRVKESARVRLPRFSAMSYGLFHGQDEMALATPISVNGFFKDKYGVSKYISMIYLVRPEQLLTY